jgi:hypothetical protein
VASVFAVVSKKVFESDARIGGKVVGIGDVWPTEKYASTHASLKPLKDGGHLFLVTVRPPNEALWLIAVLKDVTSVKDGYKAKPNTVAVVDITSLKSKIKFATGSGITAAKGKLGMSLQTPRTLTDPDVALLLAAGSGGAAAAPAAAAPAAGAPSASGKVYHLNMHEKGPLPCLCAKHLAEAGERVVVDGEAFVRREARAKDRVLYYWLPEVLLDGEKQARWAIERKMKLHLADAIDHGAGGGKKKSRGDDDDDDDDDSGDDEDYDEDDE